MIQLKETFLTKSFSNFILYVIVIVSLYTMFNQSLWRHKEGVIQNDVINYYAYLPAAFIYQDMSFDFVFNYKGDKQFNIWLLHLADGKHTIKMSMGLSILYAPFFLVGHLVAHITGSNTGGYSAPYQFFIALAAVFYLWLGLLYLTKVLRKYFSDKITGIVLLFIFFGTNLYYYTGFYPGMSHVYNFSLIAVFLYYTLQWHEKPSFVNSLWIGILIGIITLIRPSNIIIVLIFLLYQVDSFKAIINKIVFYCKNGWAVLLIIIIAMSVWIPQIMFWKLTTGKLFFYSYLDERFFWSNPQIINGLFSFRKGWLIYSPIMLLSIIGVFLMYKEIKSFFYPILIFTLASFYVVFSWWCWWYGGSFGMRPMIDYYSLFSIPMAVTLVYISNFQKWCKIMCVSFVLILFLLGVYNTVLFHFGAIHYDSMSKASYFEVFGRKHSTEKSIALLERQDYLSTKKQKEVYLHKEKAINLTYYHEVFNCEFSDTSCPKSELNPSQLVLLEGDSCYQFLGEYGDLCYVDTVFNHNSKLYAEINIKATDCETIDSLFFVCSVQGLNGVQHACFIEPLSSIYHKDKWMNVFTIIKMDNVSQEGSILHIYLWNKKKIPFVVDSFRVLME